MNKETQAIVDYITKSGHYLEKVDQLKQRYPNSKDFQVMFGYLVMEIVNEEKQFMHLSRKNIDLPSLAQRYFT